MLTIEPDAVIGVTGDCDGVVTIVVVTTAGETAGGTGGGTGGETGRETGRGMSEGGQLLTRVALVNIGCQLIS